MARILVIEDNPHNLELMTYLLEAFGHSPLVASDGGAGLAAARRELPALIVCDVHLPGIDGYQVARQLKDDLELRRIPLVAVTALAMVGDRDRLLAAGFDGYIAKPIDPEHFVEEVEHYLAAERHGTVPRPQAVQHSAPTTHAPAGAVTVLVVDDSAINRELVRDTLEPFGYRVRLAASVAEGLELAKQIAPRLIISDLHMPSEDGLRFLAAVKADPALRTIPFAIVSSTARGYWERQRAVDLGAARFLLRPLEPEALLEEVKACLREAEETLPSDQR